MSKVEEIYQFSIRFDLEFSRAMIHDLSSRDWCLLFSFLLNSVEDLLLTVLVEGEMLSWLFRFVQLMRKGRLEMGSWTVDCSHQFINGDWDIVTRFFNIRPECRLVVWNSSRRKFEFPCKNIQT
jgi:hypothetical protein